MEVAVTNCPYRLCAREITLNSKTVKNGMLFCSLKRGVIPKIRMLCFGVIINSILFHILCVWVLF